MLSSDRTKHIEQTDTTLADMEERNAVIMPPPNMPTPEYGQTARDALDKNYDICLRIATIDNPTYNRVSPIGSNPLDTENILNENNGKVCLRWEGLGTGIINVGGTGQRNVSEYSYNPEDRTMNEHGNTSTREIIDLTYPFIWTGPDNWCGINYLPPVGSKVVVGFAKNNKPMILGYLSEHYKVQYPPLKPGEVMTKGYGNNYIHNRWSNKLDLRAWAKSGEQDRDDCAGSMSSKQDCVTNIRLDADNGFIELMVNGTGIRIFSDYISLAVNGKTSFLLNEETINLVTPSSVTINAANVNTNYGRSDGN